MIVVDTKKIKEKNLTDIKKEQEEKNTPFYIEQRERCTDKYWNFKQLWKTPCIMFIN